MIKTVANARWEGDLKEGSGKMNLPSGTYEGPYTSKSRFEAGASRENGTNPEELLAAALSGCYSMYLANILSKAGHVPEYVDVEASMQMDTTDAGPVISKSVLQVRVKAPGLDDQTLQAKAQEAARDCPVSKALASVDKTVNASLVN
ncbi:MAG TPA: OsmC family peroxiredoxin [Trueperaceae bacterium]|nr:OsmC family peroxiredoxin [Trueperaceae bacterium]